MLLTPPHTLLKSIVLNFVNAALSDLREPWNAEREKYFYPEKTTKIILSDDQKNTVDYDRNENVK